MTTIEPLEASDLNHLLAQGYTMMERDSAAWKTAERKFRKDNPEARRYPAEIFVKAKPKPQPKPERVVAEEELEEFLEK